MKVAVAFDHRGVSLREAVLEALAGHDVVDLGTHDRRASGSTTRTRPGRSGTRSARRRRARRPRLRLGRGRRDRRLQDDGIRAAICHDLYSAHQAVEHDDMNVLCLGSEIVGASVARELVGVFLAAEFDGGERYVARLEKVAAMEREMKNG